MFGLFASCGLTSALPGRGDRIDGPPDAVLIAAAQRGDVKAFGTLHARYYKRIYHLAYLKTNNAQDAEDVASETFVRALANLSRFRLKEDTASFYPWLHRIALNLIVDGNRQRPPSGVVSLDAPVIVGIRSLLDAMPDAAPSPQEIAERHEVQQLVRAAIAALPIDQADVLIYRFLGDLSIQEIAPLLSRTESATKSLLHRAVVGLRREIELRVDAVERLELNRTHRSTVQENAPEEILHAGRS
ncbi:MAG: RNA polymerase sigma factor [Janthinobacterium lividum]